MVVTCTKSSEYLSSFEVEFLSRAENKLWMMYNVFKRLYNFRYCPKLVEMACIEIWKVFIFNEIYFSFAIQNLIISYSFIKSFTMCIFIHVEFRTIKVWIDILQSRNSCRPEVDFFTVLNLSNEACPFIMPLRSFSLTLFKLTAFCQKIESVQTNDDCANLPKPERIEY